ncbi:MAG: ribosome small subunit-dependent GTPase A [Lachnospiraceae bacterium]|nr:ribosome small subunit-dependent GTPase A [Candidatus Colinaster scatohippi]
MQGKIIRGIGGFYYVHNGSHIYECKAKGIFRKDGIKPLVGDDVELEVIDEEKLIGNIVRILPRKSEIIRPAVANVDQAMIIFAIQKPDPNFNLLDRFLIYMQQKGLPCIICFNKQDIASEDEKKKIAESYEQSGCRVVFISAIEGDGLETVKELLAHKTTTVAGPSGVGKSSLINKLQDGTQMETGAISEKIDRGKHTTRHSEMIAIDDDTYILDTPGFSSLSLFDMEKSELKDYYSEFYEYECNCKFLNCIHQNEPSCGVKEAVEKGLISRLRYDNYLLLLEELAAKRKY